jgi:hypothetical protein
VFVDWWISFREGKHTDYGMLLLVS